MREKRPVTFRMAPKKSTKGKDVEPEPTRDEGWLPSKCTESDILSLVDECLLQSQETIKWRSALGHTRPFKETNEIVSLLLLLNAGLEFQPLISSWPFFSLGDSSASLDPKLHSLYFYFRSSVQGFSRDRAHFDLFKYFFHLKPQPSKKELAVVGGASLQLRQGREKFYIPYKLPGKVIDWKDKWFYAENQAPPLPERTPGAPCHCGEWNTDPGSMFQVNE